MSDVDDVQARLVEHAERLRNLGAEMAAIRAEETSEDGAVTVVVDGNGALVNLSLTHTISRLSPSDFGNTVVATAKAAAARAFECQADLIRSFNSDVSQRSSDEFH